MAATHRNRLKTAVSAVASAGLGAFTISAASSGFRTFVAGDDGLTFDGITITEGTAWEVRDGCVYTHAGTSLSRGTLKDSSTGSAVAFTIAAVITQGGSAGLANSTEMLLDAFGATEIAVTAATTATIGRMHLCTGTTANYTVTLPAASGNAGKLIGFRMGTASSLTKLVTLDGNGTETIDGSLTRIMWATEVAILLCDGSNWFRIAGNNVPLSCTMLRNATVSIPNTTPTVVNLNETYTDPSGAMADPSINFRITIKRTGNYRAFGNITGAGAQIDSAQIRVYKNGALLFLQGSVITAVGAGIPADLVVPLTAGDYLQLYCYHNSGGARSVYGAAGDLSCSLSVLEIV